MLLPDGVVWAAAADWLAHGWLDAAWWQVVLYTLAMTHITIVSVTVFLHRSQAHRSLDLHPIPAHFFRFWLWLTTSIVTKEWVAIHRKHHAKCETADDPHSPQVRGLNTVLWRGAELYRREAHNADTLTKFGRGTPDDWVERHVYSRWVSWGIALLLLVNVALFGAIGLTVWAVQMAWIPFWAAGVVNGLGHFWGYRNFEAPDASTNLLPWGLLIGGEELHNNHHTYPTSAKLSVKPYEFDVGWMYIRLLRKLGGAQVKKVAPRMRLGAPRATADEKTLEALIAHRYEVMAGYARSVRRACRDEISALQAHQGDVSVLRAAKRGLHRDAENVPATVQPHLAQARAAHPVLDTMLTMREELRQLWLSTTHSREQLTADLQAWCHRAEASGIAALQEFSLRLRAVRV